MKCAKYKSLLSCVVAGLLLVPSTIAWGDAPYRHASARMGGGFGDCGCAAPVAGCGCEAPMADCCDPCRPCCVPLIPAVLGGIDRLLTRVFCCNPCCSPCETSCYECAGCGTGNCVGAGGCSSCGGGHDGMLSPPPVPDTIGSRLSPATNRTVRAQRLWNSPRPQAYRSATPVARQASSQAKPAPRPMPKASKSEPARLKTASQAKPITLEPARIDEEVGSQIRRTSYSAPRSTSVPHNPLRD